MATMCTSKATVVRLLLALSTLAGCATAAQRQVQQEAAATTAATTDLKACAKAVLTKPEYAALLPYTPDALATYIIEQHEYVTASILGARSSRCVLPFSHLPTRPWRKRCQSLKQRPLPYHHSALILNPWNAAFT